LDKKLKNLITALIPILLISLTFFSAVTLLSRAQSDAWITDPEGDVCSLDSDEWLVFWSEAAWDMGDEDLPELHVLIDILLELGDHENATCGLNEPAWVDIVQITMVEGDVNTTIEITMAGEIDGDLMVVGFSNCTSGGSGVLFGMLHLLIEGDGGPDEYETYFVIMNETDSLLLSGSIDANEISFEFPTGEYSDSLDCCTVFIAMTEINDTIYWDWATDCEFDCPTCPNGNGDTDGNGNGDTTDPPRYLYFDLEGVSEMFCILFVILLMFIITIMVASVIKLERMT